MQTYGDPTHLSEAGATYPLIEGCQREVFNPVLRASLTTEETDSASGLNIELKSPQFLTFATAPSQLRAATVTLPEGFTINPDAADGQSACIGVAGQIRFRGPGRMSRTAQDRHLLDRHAGTARNPSKDPSTSANPSRAISTGSS